jgi:hypothetical protein
MEEKKARNCKAQLGAITKIKALIDAQPMHFLFVSREALQSR